MRLMGKAAAMAGTVLGYVSIALVALLVYVVFGRGVVSPFVLGDRHERSPVERGHGPEAHGPDFCSLPGRRARQGDRLTVFENLSFGRGFHLWANPEVKTPPTT